MTTDKLIRRVFGACEAVSMKSRTLPLKLIALISLGFAALSFGSTDFLVPPGRQAWPLTIAVGPDHNLWFTELTGEKIGRLTTSGTLTEFSLAGVQSPIGIVAGPDGNIWFTDQLTGKIGHIDTNGGKLKQFSLPTGSYPQGITVGPDRNLWFVDQKENGLFMIGKITVAGKITEYATHLNAGPVQVFSSVFGQIATGPDDDLWFVNPQLANMGTLLAGKITTAGVITTYPMNDSPQGICAGADGKLYAIEGSHIAQITTAGVETEFPLSRGGWTGVTLGPDNNVWFTELARGAGYITPSGSVTEYPGKVFAAMQYLNGIVAGSDGALWLTGGNTSNLGRLTVAGQLTNVYPLNNGSLPIWNAEGPDGAVWFTESATNLIGRIDTSGTLSTFSIPTQTSQPGGITAGGDGNLWFVEEAANQVAKITPFGTVTEYSLGSTFQGLFGIAGGPDGNVWFGEYSTNNIAKVAPDGTVTQYPIPTQSSFPLFITPGSDGNLWFAENSASQIGKIDPNTGLITEYPIGANKGPGAITAGPDKNIWFLENSPMTPAIGVMNTSGQLLAEYPIAFQNFPQGLTAGSDGALWVGQNYPNAVGRVTTKGVVSSVPITATFSAPNDLVVGSDGKLWVVDPSAGEVSRLSAIGGAGSSIKATHQKPFKGTVAKFVDGTPTASKSDFSASITWGDGTKSAGTVSGPNGGPFTVSGSHTYKKVGSFKVLVSLSDNVDKSTYQASPGNAKVK